MSPSYLPNRAGEAATIRDERNTLRRQLASALKVLDECEDAIRQEVEQESAAEVRQHPILAKHKRIADRAHRLLKKHGRRR